MAARRWRGRGAGSGRTVNGASRQPTGRATAGPEHRPAGTIVCVEAIELPGGTFLEVPDEPDDLRNAMRDALAGGADWRHGLGDGTRVGVWLWAA